MRPSRRSHRRERPSPPEARLDRPRFPVRAQPRRPARRHPQAVHDARPDDRPPRRPGSAGAGGAGAQGVARRHRARRRRRHLRPARRPRLGHRRVAGPGVLAVLPAGQHRRATPPRRRAGRAARRCTGSCSGWRAADPDEVNAVLARLELRPVFTAHPTEASRQSVLAILRRVAVALDEGVDDDRLGACVDQLWQTDELRPDKPTVADEARAVGWYMEQLGRGAVPDLLGRARPRGARRRVRRSPRTPARSSWAAGWAATATATPTSHPPSPARCWSSTPTGRCGSTRACWSSSSRSCRSRRGWWASRRSCGRRSSTTGGCSRTSSPSATRSTPRSPTGSSSPTSRRGWRAPAPGSPPARRTVRASTTSARTATSTTSPSWTAPCAATSAGASPTARSPARSAPPGRSGCTWPSWTSASTPASTTPRWPPSTRRWACPTPS